MKTAVFVGDLHSGSRSSPMPPEFEACDGQIIKPNGAQRELYEHWSELAQDWGQPDILVVNGDALEGQSRKESGVPCWSTDLDDQINCAAELIGLWKAKKIYLTEGTGYHVDAAGKSLEHHLGEAIGAEIVGPKKRRARDGLFLRIGGLTFNVAHHVGIGTGWYKTTPLARELVFALLNESDFHRTDVLIRSHVHYFCGVEFHRQRAYTLPCWQLQTRYMRRKSYFGMTPSIGAIRFRVDGIQMSVDKRFFKCENARPKLIVP